jgi:peptide/nickel transport system substrate-binding protein
MSVRSGRRFRALVVLLVTGSLTVIVAVAQTPRAGPAPMPADLLKASPFDRITLIDGTVLDIEPVSPRPLPPYDPRKDRKADAKDSGPPPEGNIFLPSQKELIAKAAQAKRDEAEMVRELNITPVGEDQVYSVRRASIRSIEYFEDMLIAEGTRLAASHDFARAFEHFLRVRERVGTWKGLEAGVRRLLLEEGTDALGKGEPGRGLRLLRELHAQQADFPGLADALARAYGERIASAFGAREYAQARRILHELEGLAPGHAGVQNARAELIKAATARASVPEDAGLAEKLDGLAEALRIWPRLEGGEGRYREAFAALPTLDVAVLDVPRTPGPWKRTPAESRVADLFFRPLSRATETEELTTSRPDQLLDSVEVGDLGRRWILRLQDGFAWSDQSGPVTSRDLLRGLTLRAESGSPGFDAGWADRLSRAEILDDRRVAVTLTRPLLRPASWLGQPLGSARAGRDGRIPGPEGDRALVGTGPYRLVHEKEAILVGRAISTDTMIQRVRERRYERPAQAVEGLRSGEVTMLEHVPPWEVSALESDPEIQVGRDPVPHTHVLAIDGRVAALRNRSLRRGLSYAIAREAILEELLLRRKPAAPNVPADGVIIPGTYADAPIAEPLPTDPLLARMLVAAARKELGGEPITLTLEYPALAEAMVTVPRIAEALTNAGVTLKLVERSPDELERRLRDGEPFELAYRVVRCEEPIADLGRALCPGFDAPPGRDALAAVASPLILERLLKLEQASEFPTARGLSIQIDRATREELPIIPLWHLESCYAWRTRLTGPGKESRHLYQGIESWRIEPWYARDPW